MAYKNFVLGQSISILKIQPRIIDFHGKFDIIGCSFNLYSTLYSGSMAPATVRVHFRGWEERPC